MINKMGFSNLHSLVFIIHFVRYLAGNRRSRENDCCRKEFEKVSDQRDCQDRKGSGLLSSSLCFLMNVCNSCIFQWT